MYRKSFLICVVQMMPGFRSISNTVINKKTGFLQDLSYESGGIYILVTLGALTRKRFQLIHADGTECFMKSARIRFIELISVLHWSGKKKLSHSSDQEDHATHVSTLLALLFFEINL